MLHAEHMFDQMDVLFFIVPHTAIKIFDLYQTLSNTVKACLVVKPVGMTPSCLLILGIKPQAFTLKQHLKTNR